MVDFQSATAENRREKKKKVEEETTAEEWLAPLGGHNQ